MKKIILTIIALSSSSAFSDDIRLGQPAYGGNGCPNGSLSAALSPDSKTLSVLFDSYQAEAGYTTGRNTDRKSCNIAVPVHVPQGVSISLFQLDYRGFNRIPAGGSSRLSVDYFFAGGVGPRTSRFFSGPQSQDYLVTDQVEAGAIVWSPCGVDTNLRVNSSMVATTNSHNDQVLATVDSTDIKAGLVYHVQTRACH